MRADRILPRDGHIIKTMYIIQLWLETPARQLDRTFSYVFSRPLAMGTRVLVQFHKRKQIGFVESCQPLREPLAEYEKKQGFQLSAIQDVWDTDSLLTKELHDLALWMRQTTLSTTIRCFATMLPAKVKPAHRRQTVVMETWVHTVETNVSLTAKEALAYQEVDRNGALLYRQLRKQYPHQALSLIKKGALIREKKEREASSRIGRQKERPFPLSAQQEKAIEEIDAGQEAVYLLYGVTGSGKTEVYMELARRVLQAGKQVLILVPEIALTPQMIAHVQERFGADLAIYHSALNAQEKYEQYRKVKTRRASVVVGTRSAVFLPFTKLGLIIMDEEHDTSYKQEVQPAYHCRDIAVRRGEYHGCKVVLGSATPSLESFARAQKGVYRLITLSQRINRSLPSITLVDMKEAIRRGESYVLSAALLQKMNDRLQKKQQIILMLNRRGYSSVLRCKSCKEVIVCPHCDLAMSWHRDVRALKCHACGTTMPLPDVCPKCGSPSGFATYGYGTQRLEEEVRRHFPGVRILRMDADTTAAKNSHEKILQAFGKQEADILLGTQMIAKGLDYPNVTLVGILNGDEGLSRQDYRSCETTFDLLVQASGRSGRSVRRGEVVMQVFYPEHYAIQAAVRQDYALFYAHEMQFRHAGMYPPYTFMIALTIVGKNKADVLQTARRLQAKLSGPFKVIGVILLLKRQDQERGRIVMKGKDLEAMRASIRQALEGEKEEKTHIRIDVNPMTLE